MRIGAWGAVVCLLGVAAAGVAVAEDDGVVLSVVHGVSPGEVRLDWTGGAPTYRVYRAPSPVGVDAPGNLLGTTAGALWLDSPPPGDIFFYNVHPPCSAVAFCDDNEFCSSDVCVPDQSDGSVCSTSGECLSGYCDNGYCCASGVCCATALDCGAFAEAAACIDLSTCQGERVDGVCIANQCSATTVDDDSACMGFESQSCGPYPSVVCTSSATQPPNQAALCADSCPDDLGCDPSSHCDEPVCIPDAGQGESCDEPSDCSSGAPWCTDATCCNNNCPGTCAACDLAGSAGVCTPVPSGQDPDAECGGVSCNGFYHSWSGDQCRRKADVSAAQTACNGAGACRTQPQECTAQTSAGPVVTTCHATCQDPNLATCSGTTAGACTNVNPGTQSCGTGACQVTTNQCLNGAPAICTPGAPSTETCNNIDDNCDGAVDNGNFSDAFETNSLCTAPRVLNSVGSDQTASYPGQMTIYGAGDVDYYRILATETDSSCSCGVLSLDEDYDFRVTLTVPSGAGSYSLCVSNNSCSFVQCIEIAAGASGTVTVQLDGACGPGGQDDFQMLVRVQGQDPPGYECSPYNLSYVYDAGFCR